MLRRVLVVGAAVGGAVAAYRMVVEPWWRTWGVRPDEAATPLAGDDLVSGAGIGVETRGIDIDAPSSAVWPWLVQMGFGRAGWYSYDQLDMEGSSADRIRPEHQALTVGDTVPTHPGGGFEVRAIEPERHLVLYLDTEMVRRQADEAAAINAESPANLRMTGALMETAQPPEFRASWAFVLQPRDGGTRLIERFRIRFEGGEAKPWTRLTLPVMGFGVFVMMRKQMLGIRDRAERHPRPVGEPQPVEAATA
jgi:hypothetical protein